MSLCPLSSRVVQIPHHLWRLTPGAAGLSLDDVISQLCDCVHVGGTPLALSHPRQVEFKSSGCYGYMSSFRLPAVFSWRHVSPPIGCMLIVL